MRVETYGFPIPNNPYESYLSSYGVKVDSVAGCIVDDRTIEHADGYNSKMEHLINKRLGKDVFEEARDFSKKK
jgi:hypothetical protein